jgi:hypothetical protein
MAYDLTIHKLASGTVPWTHLYHNYVQAVQDALNTLDVTTAANTAALVAGGILITDNTTDIAANKAALIAGGILITDNTTDIAANKAALVAGGILITDNTTDIAANKAALVAGGLLITDNTTDIATNKAALIAGGLVLDAHTLQFNNTLTYTYVERINGFRTSPVGVHTYATTDARLDIMQAKLDFIMDTLKQLNVPYLDDALNVVPSTTPNP